MSDNKESKLEDRGWAEMRSILDKELPERKENRRPIIWFFFGTAAMAIIVATSLFVFPVSDENTKFAGFEKSVEVETEPKSNKDSHDNLNNVPYKKENTILENVSENQKARINDISQINIADKDPRNRKDEINDQSINITTKINKPSTKSFISNNDKAIKYINDEIVNSKKTKRQNEQESKIEPQVETTVGSAIKPNTRTIANKIENITKSENIEETELILERDDNKPIIIPVLRSPLFSPLTIDKVDRIDKKNKPVIAILSKNSFSPYVFASIMHRPNLNRLGYGMGIGLDYKRRSFDIYMEASYFRSKYNRRSSSVSADNDTPEAYSPQIVTDKEIFFPSFEFANQMGEIGVSNFTSLTTSTDEINMNLGLRKQVFRKLNLNAGISVSYLLNATNMSFLLSLNPSEPIQERTYLQLNTSELHDSGAYASYDVMPHLGIEYSISPNIHLGFNYNYGLKNLISNTELNGYSSFSENEEIYRRHISAKIRCQF